VLENYSNELGAGVYSSMNIHIAETARPAAATILQFIFFDAHSAAIISLLGTLERRCPEAGILMPV
jgi:hypothetical protein